MTSLPITLGVVGIVSGLLLFLFKNRNRRIRLQFQVEADRWQTELDTHTMQIIQRKKGLAGYDFLTYNIEEVLIVQHTIKI